ncbi:MAG: hypothetical protein DWQ40_00295 [Actinobacteria bacterium]|nr:MAG: hypothetical protein DWQ40_00295 [Actinomycetota bacterium]REK35590.1 MAG: hypothetical protein DWQ20_06090 [Actinomycetota bacterium]
MKRLIWLLTVAVFVAGVGLAADKVNTEPIQHHEHPHEGVFANTAASTDGYWTIRCSQHSNIQVHATPETGVQYGHKAGAMWVSHGKVHRQAVIYKRTGFVVAGKVLWWWSWSNQGSTSSAHCFG